MFMERVCKLCGEIFTPLNANQQYCCKECRKIAENKRRREKSRSHKIKKERLNRFGVVPPIDYIVDICEKVREKTGRIVNYGYVSNLCDCGKLDSLGVNL